MVHLALPIAKQVQKRLCMKEPTKDQRPRPEGLLTTQGVADRLGIAPATVEWWRSQNQGPKFIRLGRSKRAPIRLAARGRHRSPLPCQRGRPDPAGGGLRGASEPRSPRRRRPPLDQGPSRPRGGETPALILDTV